MPGLRVTVTQREDFYGLVGRGATIASAARDVGVSPATGYRLAHRARSKFREIVCPTCRGTGRMLWRLPQIPGPEAGLPEPPLAALTRLD